jgi:hypothetical protein
MRVSKYIKPNRDILIEYIYDDGNNIGESYKILQNLRDNSLSYLSGSSSITNNEPSNQLVQLDPVTNNYGLLNTDTYGFLQIRDYSSGFPIRHDTIKVHLPVNYTFGEYLGFHIRAYTFDFINKTTYTLSNFFFDGSNLDQAYLLNFTSPAFYFQEKLWGKNIQIMIPSVYAISRQRSETGARPNTINSNLTNGFGLSQTSPVFIEFHFITQKRVVNSVTTYNLTAKTSISVPQAPDFENIGVKIQPSPFGDYFEIFGTFNGDINQFDNFIQGAVANGNRYFVNFTITLYEQNIRGKSFTITLTDNFNEKIEFRPIIKFSTTTAIIDVEMNMIDSVDESSIYRKASYGMLQDEVAKYSLNLTKINIANAAKPKIYNIKSPEGAGIFGNSRKRISIPKTNQSTAEKTSVLDSIENEQIKLEIVKVNYAVLTNMFSVVAKSDNVIVGKNTFYGLGKLEIILQPFDNVIQFKIAQDVSEPTTISTLRAASQDITSPIYMDLTGMGEIKLVIKNDKIYFETTLFFGSNEIDLSNGIVVFKISASKMSDIRKIYTSGYNVFYITSSTDSGTVVIYSGIFTIYDTIENINNLKSKAVEAQQASLDSGSRVIQDPELSQQATAIVTPSQLSIQSNNLSSNNGTSVDKSTSVESTTKIKKTTYSIDSKSNLSIDGYLWTNLQIKEVLGLPNLPTQLSFKSDGLYTFNKFLDKLVSLENKLKSRYIKTAADKEKIESTQNSFLNR